MTLISIQDRSFKSTIIPDDALVVHNSLCSAIIVFGILPSIFATPRSRDCKKMHVSDKYECHLTTSVSAHLSCISTQGYSYQWWLDLGDCLASIMVYLRINRPVISETDCMYIMVECH